MAKLSKETYERRLNSALKQLDKMRKINTELFESNHKSQVRIMQLEEENAYLRDEILAVAGRE